ncbi:MAG TPA: hypothetical protein V6C72_06675, partial [Chroococcales cyanobacterium]
MSGMAEEFEPTTNHQIGNYAWLSSQHQSGTTSTAAKLSGFREELPAPLYKQVAEPDGSGFSKHHIIDNNRVVHDREQRIVFVQYADGTTLRRF